MDKHITQAFGNKRKKLWHYIRDALTKKGNTAQCPIPIK
jgi:hypothetical protein